MGSFLEKQGDAILPRKRPLTRAMSKRLQEDWARDAEEGPRVLTNLPCDVVPCGACRPCIFFINGVLCFLEDEWKWNREVRKMIGDPTSRRR